MPPNRVRRAFRLAGIVLTVAGALFTSAVRAATPDIFRSWFTPTVVPTNFAGNVRFEAEITGGPASVVFNYNSVPRLMYDDGSNGDLVAGDNVWTCLFTANEIISKNVSNRVFRPVIGTCVPTNAGAFNSIAEVWTSQIGLVPITTNLAATNQHTDYVVNFVASKSQLTNFNAAFWSSNFFKFFPGKFDFLNFVHIAGVRGNRYHAGVHSTVTGIGQTPYNFSTNYGSTNGRLQGYTVFPIPSFYDGGSPTFDHETGHQWIDFLSGTAYSNGVPHWPKGDIAINVMGFSIAGSGAGGNFPYTFTNNGTGGYITGLDVATNHSTFNPMELYLIGLAASNEVPTYFVFTNQNINPSNGQVFNPPEFTLVTLSNVVAAHGARVPGVTNSQRTFRSATIILSEQLLDQYAMSLYDFFTRRIEARTPLAYSDGLATGTSNPWFLATRGRSVMYSRLTDEIPDLDITVLTNNDASVNFTGLMGINYQPQHSAKLATWTNVGAAISVPITNPPADLLTNFIHTPAAGTNQGYYRLKVIY